MQALERPLPEAWGRAKDEEAMEGVEAEQEGQEGEEEGEESGDKFPDDPSGCGGYGEAPRALSAFLLELCAGQGGDNTHGRGRVDVL